MFECMDVCKYVCVRVKCVYVRSKSVFVRHECTYAFLRTNVCLDTYGMGIEREKISALASAV